MIATEKQGSDAKRRPIDTISRGDSHLPCAVAASVSRQQRVCRVKLALDRRKDSDRALWQRLRDLGWQAARYRNMMLREKWAKAMGWRAESEEKNATSKQVRKEYKKELSGDAYSCAEQEAKALWTRHAKRILAGAPLPEIRPDAALSISGREKWEDSGIQVKRQGDWYILRLRAQADTCADGCWFEIPIAKGLRSDEFLQPLFERFVAHETPIKKCTLDIGRREIIAHLTYPVEIALPEMGARVATLGPVGKEGRLSLRSELQTRDYTRKITLYLERKDSWDLIRRRLMATLGRGKGHARRKRRALSMFSIDDWTKTHLDMWTADLIEWCESQGVGRINLVGLETLDWPAYKFREMLRWKAEERGILVVEEELDSESADRATKGELRKRAKEAKRRRDAVRELADQLKE